MQKGAGLRHISNERPGVLVLEKYSHCGIAWYSHGEMRLGTGHRTLWQKLQNFVYLLYAASLKIS